MSKSNEYTTTTKFDDGFVVRTFDVEETPSVSPPWLALGIHRANAEHKSAGKPPVFGSPMFVTKMANGTGWVESYPSGAMLICDGTTILIAYPKA